MKKLFLFLALAAGSLALADSAQAQLTTVTATIVDPNGVPYRNGTLSFQLLNPGGGTPLLNGVAVNPSRGPMQLDVNGAMSPLNMPDNAVILPGGSTWSPTICSVNSGACITLPGIIISGASQDLSATINALIVRQVSGGNLPFPSGGPTDWLNVKSPNFAGGAKGGAKKVIDAVVVNGNKTITSATASFTQANVGFTLWCTNGNGGVDTFGSNTVTTITSINSTTSIQVANAPTSSANPARCVFGPAADDGPAFLAAVNASGVSANCTDQIGASGPQTCFPKTVYIPCDGYIIKSQWYNLTGIATGFVPPSIQGCSVNSTVLYISPAAGAGQFPNIVASQGFGFFWREFTEDGDDYLFPNASGFIGAIAIRNGCRRFLLEDILVSHLGFSQNSNPIYELNGSFGEVNNIGAYESTTGGVEIGALITGGFTLISPHISNHFQNLVFMGAGGRSPNSTAMNVVGGFGDECTASAANCNEAISGSNVNITGTQLYAGAATQAAFHVDGTSTAYFNDASVGAFSSAQNIFGLRIDAGGQVFASTSTFRGNAADVAIVNNGSYQDVGGNVYQNCVGLACTPATLAQSFSGNAPVASLTHSTWNGFCTGTITANEPCGGWTPDQNIAISAQRVDFGTQGATCAPVGTITASNGTQSITINLTNATSPVTQTTFQTFPANTPITVKVATIGTGCGTVPANLNVGLSWQSNTAP